MRRMKGLNELNDAAIARFASAKKIEEVAASLALLNNSAPTDLVAKVLEGTRADLVLIPCKSAGLTWPTATFTDRSTPGAGGAGTTNWWWNFGDPASGSGDSATVPDPVHRFSAPGTYRVTGQSPASRSAAVRRPT